MMSSFMMNLTPSAIGWNRPNGPTRFGPQRNWITPDSRRSTQVMTDTPPISAPTIDADLEQRDGVGR